MNKLPWFKHWANASDDDFLYRAETEFGPFGYSAFFKLIELLHNHGTGNILKMEESRICSMLRCNRTKVQLYLNFGSTWDKFSYKYNGTEVELEIKKYRQLQYNLQGKKRPKLAENNPKTVREGEGEGEGEGETTIKPTALAVPKKRMPIQNIIRSYMVSREIDPDDKSWWKTNGGRAARAAKAVFEAFGNEKTAMQYVIIKADEFKEKGLDYTLETIARHAHDHKGELNVTLNAGKKPQTAMVPNPVSPVGSLGGPTQQGEKSAIGKQERFDKLGSGVLRALPHIGTNES